MRSRPLLLACCLLVVVGVAAAQARDDAERKLKQVQTELKSVAAERRKLEGQRGEASRTLRQADEQVGGVQRTLRKTQDTLRQDNAALVELQAERARLARDEAAKRAELARLLRAAQVAGQAAPLKALLAQDRVAEAERALAYQGYLQRSQVERLRVLSAELQRLDTVQREIAERRASLDQATRAQAAQLASLQRAREARARLLAGIDQQYKDRASREKALGRDAKALQGLLAQLRAAAARAARDAARAKARTDADPARRTDAGKRRPTVASAPPLRVGGLGWPVAGNLLASFGGRLPDGRRSDGVLIAAPAGATIKAVADGAVVFADWMTGYGNILIVDHGNGYMSLYAHADGLLKDPGTPVRRGDPVATVGTSGGQEMAALYFELRRNGTPVNPAGWLTRQ